MPVTAVAEGPLVFSKQYASVDVGFSSGGGGSFDGGGGGGVTGVDGVTVVGGCTEQAKSNGMTIKDKDRVIMGLSFPSETVICREMKGS
jgi:hypothetical protein